ncbi:MAG: DUF3866 family protein, partial [Acidimicrobiales bacterium]
MITERRGLQRVQVDGEPAYVLTQLIGPVGVGDRVVVNTTAVDLGLGSGGWHVVHWNLSRDAWSQPGAGPVMKLRYTSLQVDTGDAELGAARPRAAPGGVGAPVVACSLHSQLGAVAVAFAHRAPQRRLAYVMTDEAALPLALSDLVHDLRTTGRLSATVSCGQAFGGEHEALNLHAGLAIATGRLAADAVVVAPGPGLPGTGTELGFGAMALGTAVDAAASLGLAPIVAVRASAAD